jgi:hypothetical protein
MGTVRRVGWLLVAMPLVAGCGTARLVSFHDPVSGVMFRHPAGWSVTGFSRTNSPPRLVLASYPVTRSEVEGDCGGFEAFARLPKKGVAVLLIDYGPGGAGSDFRPRPKHLRLDEFERAHYDCFGDSYMRRFSVRGVDFQAHVALGREAGAAGRSEALQTLDSLTVAGG